MEQEAAEHYDRHDDDGHDDQQPKPPPEERSASLEELGGGQFTIGGVRLQNSTRQEKCEYEIDQDCDTGFRQAGIVPYFGITDQL